MRAPSHKKFYVTNIKGGVTSQDFRFELLNEKLKDDKDDEAYVSDALIILTPIGAKRMFAVLKDSIELYEKEHGEIPQDPQDDKYI